MQKKYLLVIPSLKIGGAEKQAIRLACYMKTRGIDTTILSNNKKGPLCDMCEVNGIPWDRLDSPNKFILRLFRMLERFHLLPRNIKPYNEALSIRLADYIKEGKYDYCIAYCIEACTWVGRAARYYRKAKYVWYQRDAGIFNTGDSLEKSAIKACDLVLANSTSGKQYLKRAFNVDATIIPNGVRLLDSELSSTEWRNRIGVSEDDIVCTMIANLHSAKDHLSILRIWYALKISDFKQLPVLVFAGRFDDMYSELVSYTKSHGIDKYVKFIGQISDVTGLLSATDICVFGAKSEGSPNGIIEATLMALPVLATDIPEIREVVSEANYSFLFSNGDIEDGKNKLKCLVENKSLRKQIGKDNLRNAQVKFDEKRNFDRLISLIES